MRKIALAVDDWLRFFSLVCVLSFSYPLISYNLRKAPSQASRDVDEGPLAD